ncbi:class I SAM-dependent methyltransferase [Kribbella solani]|uniref:class I SAM-dependent methyltransferase n=1 Tax=Kribbella solani TaxID=236067 RepID=UPI0029A3EE0F|nr:class I SAM-dependent methyltransferase [Kribbella solani]MDX2968809.1 class I SAM-dependent methyltransferase [Kribbella solani]
MQTGQTGHSGSSGHIELARAQQERWDSAYARKALLHGVEPSSAARWAVEAFGAAGIDDVLELGAGHGRDALFLARQGFSVHATDFSETALDQLRLQAQRDGLDDRVTAALHDVRDPLPPADATVDAVFANLLLNMAFAPSELRSLVAEIHRVLCPGGRFVYAVWSTDDPCSRHWQQLDDGLSVHEGFVGRFFDETLVAELGANWRLDETAPYEEGRRRMWRVTMTKADGTGTTAEASMEAPAETGAES